MQAIRVPQEAKPLLSLCRKHTAATTDPSSVLCFDTYADLIVFAAARGFHHLRGKAPNRSTKFLDQPNPIDLFLFKNDRRFPQILFIALATARDKDVVRDEATICRLIEDFAAVGCTSISQSLSSRPGEPHLAIADLLIEAPHTDDDGKI